MNDPLPIVALADPGPWAQWVGIVVTCLGTILSFAAYLAAKGAGAAARDAKTAAERSAAVSELRSVQEDLTLLASACAAKGADLSAVATAATKIAARLGVAAASLRDVDQDAIRRAANQLREVSPATLVDGPSKAEKAYRVAQTVSAVQATVTDAQHTARRIS